MNLLRPRDCGIKRAIQFDQRRLSKRWCLSLGVPAVLMTLVILATISFLSFRSARADLNTVAADNLRTGWYPNQTNLAPDMVSGGTFGQLFSANVDGQVYAQPLISQGTLFVATETNNIYGLDPVTGTQKWMRNLGTPFNPVDISCSDLAPWVGITGTPVIDATTNIAYFTSKTYVNGKAGPAVWYMHAVSVVSGVEQKGFPVQIQGVANNDTSHLFNPVKEMQRPGLLLMNGVVYAAFGGHCDRKPYEGWIVGIATTGRMTTLWTDEAGDAENDPLGPGGGIWMPGGGLVSDGSGQIIFSSGNGKVPPAHSSGKLTPPGALAQTITRLKVQSDGSFKVVDFFSPYDADLLNHNDADLGSGSPIELPPPYFGTKAYPHLLIGIGKQGYLYLLNADNLGGRNEGKNNSDAVISRVGPNGGVWGKPAVWPGDGGYVYTTTAQGGGGSGKLKAYRYGLDGAGEPTLNLVSTTSDTFGFGSSGPVITSSGTATGSALIWVIWSPDGTGVGAQLRAYDPVPPGMNAPLHLRFSAPIGTSSKFTPPGVDNNHVYVGTRDGHVLGFGSPTNSPISGNPLDLGNVIVGKSVKGTLTLKANTKLTITAQSLNNSVFTVNASTPQLPVTLTSGESIKVTVKFKPITFGLSAATLAMTTSVGRVTFGISGNGVSAKGQISVAPAPISFGGIAAGSTPITATTTFTNVGATPIKVKGSIRPKEPFTVSGLPADNSSLAPMASVTVTISFAPTVVGSYTDELSLLTTGGQADVPISGTSGTAGRLTISSTTINLGNVPVGANGTASFTVSNTGGSPLNITRSKYPIGGVGFTPFTSLPEGTAISPGSSLTETVLFSPIVQGPAMDSWVINSDDGTGVKTINFIGNGIRAVPNPTLPSLSIADASVIQPVSGSTVASFIVTLSTASNLTTTVTYTTKDGTATVANGDYVAEAGILTFNPGEITKTIPVAIKGRSSHGPATTFSIELARPTNAVIADGSAKGHLDKAMGLNAIYVGAVSVKASSKVVVNATVHVWLTDAPLVGEPVTVTMATANDVAIAGKDYVALPPTVVTFAPGEIGKVVTVKVLPVPANMGNKTFFFNLSSPSENAIIADGEGRATIINGGAMPAPSVYIDDLYMVRPTVGTTNAIFTVRLSEPAKLPITVNYATHDGLATVANGQYMPAGGSITFNAGDIVKQVSVMVKGDQTYDSDLYFYLNLIQATNAVIGDGSARGTLINQLGRYMIAVSDTSVIQNPTSQALVKIPLSLNASVASGQAVTVQIATADGSALAGNDYLAIPLTAITFNAGQKTIWVPVFILPNVGHALRKTFTLKLISSSLNNSLITNSGATISIISHG